MPEQLSWNQIPGWFSFADVYDLEIAKATHYDIFVEVGSFLGQSTAYLGQTIRRAGKQIRVHAVDTWEGSPEADPESQAGLLPWLIRYGGNLFGVWKRHMELCDLDDIVQHYCGPSVEAAKRFADESVQFVYLDGAHDTASVKADLEAWWPKLKPGCVIAGHDWVDYRVQAAVKAFFPGREIKLLTGRPLPPDLAEYPSWLMEKTNG